MKYTLYKPNSKNTGAAFSFDLVNDRNNKPVLFVSMIQQHSWNDSAKTGSFKENAKNPEKSATIKLTENEAGEFLSSFKTRIPYVAFHKKDDSTTIIKLTPWDKARKVKEQNGEQSFNTPAWGFSVSKNSSQLFKLPIEAGEAEVLSELFRVYITKVLESSGNEYKKEDRPQQYQKKAPRKEYQEKSTAAVVAESEEDDVPF
jgi:hypothetical protein